MTEDQWDTLLDIKQDIGYIRGKVDSTDDTLSKMSSSISELFSKTDALESEGCPQGRSLRSWLWVMSGIVCVMAIGLIVVGVVVLGPDTVLGLVK